VSATAQADASAKPLSADVTVSKPVPSDRADTLTPVSSQPSDVNKPTIATSETKPTPDVSMIPSASASASVTSSAPATSDAGSLPPCGWPAGGKGGFLNDAQVAHAVLTANAIDSVASAGILTRTQNAAVRDYAQMMVREHTDANRQVAAIIDRTHIAPAENDISTSILRDSTGHIFASTALSTQVMGQTVSPVTQPAKPVASSYSTAPSSATATCTNGMAGMSMTSTTTATTTTTPTTANPSATTTATVTTPSASATTGCSTSTAALTTPLSGDDRNYIDYMVQSHQSVLDALNNRLIPFAWNPELKAGLEAMKPVVQRHLDRAREIQRGQTASNY
jgi:predicted outer membrane protein